jgi:hypothetical protein
MKKPDFMKPKVFIYNRGDTKILTIVYFDRDETYEQIGSSTFKQIADEQGYEFTRNEDIDMMRGNRAREVHYSDKFDVAGLSCICKKYDPELKMGSGGCTCKIIDDTGKEIQDLATDYIELEQRI